MGCGAVLRESCVAPRRSAEPRTAFFSLSITAFAVHSLCTLPGLFHVFASGSPTGTSTTPNPSKVHEQIGWAVSEDGLNFTEVPWNPVVAWNESQPHTIALAEGHVWMDDASGLLVVFHTVRWDRPNAPSHVDPPYSPDPFAPDGRNAEDLGMSILSPSSTFAFDLPLITPVWGLELAAGEESPCAFDWKRQRYCSPLKAIVGAAAVEPLPRLAPTLSFAVSGRGCQTGGGGVTVRVYSFGMNGVTKEPLEELPVTGSCSSAGAFVGHTAGVAFGQKYGLLATWIAGNVALASDHAGLTSVLLTAHYDSDGAEWQAQSEAAAEAAIASA